MKKSIVKKNTSQSEARTAAVFREKSKKYLVCFVDRCPLRDRCLRYLVGQQGEADVHVVTSVNPHFPKVGGESCGRYRYYEMRNGTRLITPGEQLQIAEVCRLHGWTGDLNYDGEQEDWLW